MRRAVINDLLKEIWLRNRNRGEIVWVTKDGKEIPINEMTDQHLLNAIEYLTRKREYDEIAADYSAYITEHFD